MKYTMIRKKILCAALAGTLAFGGAAFGNIENAWALPASGTATEEVFVRETAVDGELVGNLTAEQSVSISDETEGSDGMTWYQITFTQDGQEKTGWVRSDFLTTSDDAASEEALPSNSDGGETEAAETTEEAPAEEAAPEEEAAPSSITFTYGDSTYSVMSELPEGVSAPEGFTPSTIEYNGEETTAYQFGSSDVFLFYMKNVGDENDQKFFVYDSERDAIFPYVNISGVVLLNKPVEAKVSSFFAETTFSTDAGEIPSYQIASDNDLLDKTVPSSEFYYVYGVNASGQKGWYCYDSTNGTLQRSMTNMQYITPDKEEETPAQEDTSLLAKWFGDKADYVLYGLAAACVIFLILMIVFASRSRKFKKMVDGDAIIIDPDAESWLDKMDDVNLHDEVRKEKGDKKKVKEKVEKEKAKKEEKIRKVMEKEDPVEKVLKQKDSSKKQKPSKKEQAAKTDQKAKTEKKPKARSEQVMQSNQTAKAAKAAETQQAVSAASTSIQSQPAAQTVASAPQQSAAPTNTAVQQPVNLTEDVVNPKTNETPVGVSDVTDAEKTETAALDQQTRDMGEIPSRRNHVDKMESVIDLDSEPDFFDEEASDDEEAWIKKIFD